MKFKRVQKLQIPFTHRHYSYYDNFCYKTNQLRNKALYYLRKTWFDNQENWNKPGFRKSISWSLGRLDKELNPTPMYQSLPTKVAQATIRVVIQDWNNFLSGLFDYYRWIKNPDKYPNKYKARPNPPNYIGTREIGYTDGRSIVHCNYQTMVGGTGKVEKESGKRLALHGRARSLSIAPLGIITLFTTDKDFKHSVP